MNKIGQNLYLPGLIAFTLYRSGLRSCLEADEKGWFLTQDAETRDAVDFLLEHFYGEAAA